MAAAAGAMMNAIVSHRGGRPSGSGLRLMINALLNSVIQLLEVMVLTFVCLVVFSMIAFELFSGRLRSKCVVIKGGTEDKHRYPPIDSLVVGQYEADKLWNEWVNDFKNWKHRSFPNDEPVMCGNSSDMRQCGSGYTCLSLLGDNPNNGWVSFDSFFESMLSTFQVLTLDYWERIYDLVVSTNGILSLFFFLLVIFLGSYYLLNLMLAVVAMSYENEARLQEQSYLTCSEKLRKARKKSNFSFDDLGKINICKMTHYRQRTKSELEMRAKRLKVEVNEEEEKMARQGEVEYVDTIFGLIGMHMTLGQAEVTEDKVRLASVSSMAYDPFGSDAGDNQDENVEDKNNERFVQRSRSESDVEILDTDSIYRINPSSIRMRYLRVTTFLSACLKPIVYHRVFEYFITFCIIINTIVLGLEHHGQSREFDDYLQIGNYIFMAIFTAEAIIKILAMQCEYFDIKWNIFDFVIVGLSYLDFCLDYFKQGGHSAKAGNGLSVIRSFRLPYLKCFSIFLPILIVGNFIVLNLFLALLLNSFDSEELNAQREKEMEACGRTENLKNIVGLLLQKGKSMTFSKVESDHHEQEQNLEHEHNQPSLPSIPVLSVTETLGALSVPTIDIVKSDIDIPSPSKSKSQRSRQTLAGRRRFKKLIKRVMIKQRTAAAERVIARMENKREMNTHLTESKMLLKNPASCQPEERFHSNSTPTESIFSERVIKVKDCFPKKCQLIFCRYRSKPKTWRVSPWDRFRSWCVVFASHPAFEGIILLLIVASSITLCFEDIYLDSKPTLKWVLCLLNMAFTGIFFVEMIIKWFAIGIYGYFTNFWTILDGFIVLVSCISAFFDFSSGACSITPGGMTATSQNFVILKALRTLRALRPLRAISRWEGMKVLSFTNA
ncbi:unnamed protein product [Orchesella dallaii]|uniref:Ion transport domain-containing protein n=1 Tax=Orchesella dallaii TaxID=48710 RepID=A0ABP1Q967_9HEXA